MLQTLSKCHFQLLNINLQPIREARWIIKQLQIHTLYHVQHKTLKCEKSNIVYHNVFCKHEDDDTSALLMFAKDDKINRFALPNKSVVGAAWNEILLIYYLI